MDNILIQVVGRKRVILFPPSDVPCLYLTGDKSRVMDLDAPDTETFPNFSQATRWETLLEPGDVLYIPALWFHNVTTLDFGVAVNVFWRHLEAEFYDSKDTYGNKDPPQVQRSLQMVERAAKALSGLPEEHRQFYGHRLLAHLEEKLKACSDGT
jgi:tRNA wybutosine-synthesizing protein 5